MSTFREQRLSDLAVFFNQEEFGRPAVYLPVAGAATNVTVILEEIDLLAAGAMGVNPAGVVKISVRAAEVPAPKVHDRITVDGTDWMVSEVVRQKIGIWLLLAVSKERLGC